MRAVILLLLAGAAFAQAPAFQNVGTMSQLMVDVIYPASDAVFYISVNPPKNDHDWDAMRMNALMVAEAANLLMLPGRARDQEKWIADAKLMLDAGTLAYKAARAKDVDALNALNQQLVDACTTCHRDYRPNYGRRKQAPKQ